MVLGEQRVEVVARHSAWDIRIATPDLVGVLVPELCQPSVDDSPRVAVIRDDGG